jgi:hypothetical protein
MKTIKIITKFSFLGLSIAILLSSCSMEKRLYSSGYHIEWNKRNEASNKSKSAERHEKSIKAEKSEEVIQNTVLAEPANQIQKVEQNVVTASVDDKSFILSSPAEAIVHEMEAVIKVESKIIKNKAVTSPKVLKPNATKGGDKNWLVAVLLCFFLGGLGIHRFYLGYTWQGVVQLLTFGGFGIWALIDLFRIIFKNLKPKDGDYN